MNSFNYYFNFAKYQQAVDEEFLKLLNPENLSDFQKIEIFITKDSLSDNFFTGDLSRAKQMINFFVKAILLNDLEIINTAFRVAEKLLKNDSLDDDIRRILFDVSFEALYKISEDNGNYLCFIDFLKKYNVMTLARDYRNFLSKLKLVLSSNTISYSSTANNSKIEKHLIFLLESIIDKIKTQDLYRFDINTFHKESQYIYFNFSKDLTIANLAVCSVKIEMFIKNNLRKNIVDFELLPEYMSGIKKRLNIRDVFLYSIYLSDCVIVRNFRDEKTGKVCPLNRLFCVKELSHHVLSFLGNDNIVHDIFDESEIDEKDRNKQNLTVRKLIKFNLDNENYTTSFKAVLLKNDRLSIELKK